MKPFFNKNSILFYLIVLVFGGSTGAIYTNYKHPADKNFELFKYTWNIINSDYLDQKNLDSQKMMYGAVGGMVASLGDPFTVFLTPSEHSAFQASLTGIYEGSGLEIEPLETGYFNVKTVYKESSAERVGIKKGDTIVAINNKSANLWSLNEAKKTLNDKKGVVVKIETISPIDLNKHKFEFMQDVYIPPSVEYSVVYKSLDKKIGLIQVKRFGDQTLNEWKQIVADAEIEKLDGLILDLRDNLGGYTDVPLYIASEFIASGDIYSQVDNHGNKKIFQVNHSAKFKKTSLAILINKKSISATEMLAASLRFHNRGVLVGERSFGKGTEQDIKTLSDGSGLHITISKWFKPDGSSVDKVGLTPDFEVLLTSEDKSKKIDSQLNKAIQVLLDR